MMDTTAYDPQAAYLAADRAWQAHYRLCACCRLALVLASDGRLCLHGRRLLLRQRATLADLEVDTDTALCDDAF